MFDGPLRVMERAIVRNDEFEKFHPATNLLFFVLVITISMIQMQVGMIAVSFLCATVYFFMQKKSSGIKQFLFVLAAMVFASIINPLFSHKGTTILGYLPGGNPVTLESIYFGLAAGCILAAVLLWFSSFNEILSDDKLTATIGKVFPSISMIISMVFRFISKYSHFAKRARSVQKANGFTSKNRLKKWNENI